MKLLEYLTEPELRDLLNKAGQAVVDAVTSSDVEKPLFVLLLFNDPKLSQYVSNCRRKDMIMSLRETASRLENNEDVPR